MSYVQSTHTSRGGRLNKDQAIKTLRAKGYDDAEIANILRQTASPWRDERTGTNRADLYSVANYPDKKATTPTTTPTTPTTPTKPTTPAAPTETPHQKAVRLAREGAAKYYTGAYGDLALGAGDPYGVNKRFNDLVNAALTAIPASETTINLNNADLFNKAVTGSTTAQQNILEQAVNKITPSGYQNTYWADTADDAILNEILTGQKNDVTTNFKRQLERGQISQGAYDYAMNQLGSLESGANSQLQSLGGGVISGYRNDITDIVDAFNKEVAGYELGKQINPNTLTSNINTNVAANKAALKGDILKAFGNTQLFDPNALISKAGSVTGPSNQPIQGGNPQGTGAVSQEEQDKRTIGTSGVF